MKKIFHLILIFTMGLTTMATTIEFQLKTSTDVSDVYITGNLEQLGKWDPSKIRMKKDNGTFFYKISLDDCSKDIEYKYTLGNWNSVEKDKEFNDVPNHIIKFTELIGKNKFVRTDEINVFGNKDKKIKSSLTGNFDSFLLFNYKIIVYLPPDYEKNLKKDYPLLIMHDGQNLFDQATAFGGNEWNCDESAQDLIKRNVIKPLIIAGIYNRGSKRMIDYTPTFDKNIDAGGKGDVYLDFIVKRLLPYLKLKFRISDDGLSIGGSSLGGLISLYSMIKYPDTFKNIMAISPSVWWDDKYILKNIKKTSSRIWLDIGTLEGDIIKDDVSQACLDARDLYKKMKNIGCDVFYKEYKGERHNESSWSKRFPEILEFFYKRK
ncbi:MAG: esterase [Candidatus Muiribacterium halophilum]|uniref:Esterase n=1 Tax=Muiribacterium halophilum TaxID=2053465 RepID=A0A2N5ZG62_MUIH1|nr:MAG: esterase [Candidatus Muirbacterium halophilum]